MVAVAGYSSIYVRDKCTASIIPGAQVIKDCEVPEDTLGV